MKAQVGREEVPDMTGPKGTAPVPCHRALILDLIHGSGKLNVLPKVTQKE